MTRNAIKNFIWKLYGKINNLPDSVRLEICSLCQLNCRDCYMRNEKITDLVIKPGYLKLEDFKKFSEKNPYIRNIELSFSGEIFLNPDLDGIMKYSYENDINLTALNGVNFNSVSEQTIENLVKYQFKAISFSIDGASNDTYIKYRRNGNFDVVIENIKKLNYYKKKYNSKFPVLAWSYIIFKHNLEEVEKAVTLARENNMYYIVFNEPWNMEVTRSDTKFANRVFLLQKKDKEIIKAIEPYQIYSCYQLYKEPQINIDGNLLGCCRSTNTHLNVNVFDVGLKKALKSPKMKEMMQIASGTAAPRLTDDYACNSCFLHNNLLLKNSFIRY